MQILHRKFSILTLLVKPSGRGFTIHQHLAFETFRHYTFSPRKEPAMCDCDYCKANPLTHEETDTEALANIDPRNCLRDPVRTIPTLYNDRVVLNKQVVQKWNLTNTHELFVRLGCHFDLHDWGPADYVEFDPTDEERAQLLEDFNGDAERVNTAIGTIDAVLELVKQTLRMADGTFHNHFDCR